MKTDTKESNPPNDGVVDENSSGATSTKKSPGLLSPRCSSFRLMLPKGSLSMKMKRKLQPVSDKQGGLSSSRYSSSSSYLSKGSDAAFASIASFASFASTVEGSTTTTGADTPVKPKGILKSEIAVETIANVNVNANINAANTTNTAGCCSTTTKKCVTFTSKSNTRSSSKPSSSLNRTVYVIEPIEPQQISELWWTTEETSRSKVEQSDFTNATKASKALAREYLMGVHNGRTQVRKQQQYQLRQQDVQGHDHYTTEAVSTEHYNRLVRGRTHGLGGLEMYMEKRDAVQNVTKMIVKRYKEERRRGSRSSFLSSSSLSPLDKNNDDNEFCSFVQSVTFPDRVWAYIVGQADMEAAASPITIS